MTRQMRVKICGLTRPDDAAVAIEAGAWAIGAVLSPVGPRSLDLSHAAAVFAQAPESVERVGVFVSPTSQELEDALAALPLSRVQIHGELSESAREALGLPLIRVRSFSSRQELSALWPDSDELTLLDSVGPGGRGGTGTTLDWQTLGRQAPPWPYVLAGGLDPENVSLAVAATSPYAVDVSSGVEAEPGIKDHAKVTSFITNARTGPRQ